MCFYCCCHCRPIHSSGSLGSLSSDDSGCEAGSDSENNLSTSPSASTSSSASSGGITIVAQKNEDKRRKDSFGFEDYEDENVLEEEEEDDEEEIAMREWSVKDRARTLLNRVRNHIDVL